MDRGDVEQQYGGYLNSEIAAFQQLIQRTKIGHSNPQLYDNCSLQSFNLCCSIQRKFKPVILSAYA